MNYPFKVHELALRLCQVSLHPTVAVLAQTSHSWFEVAIETLWRSTNYHRLLHLFPCFELHKDGSTGTICYVSDPLLRE